MLLRRYWAVLLLCATARFWGWLGLAAPPEKVGTPPQIHLRTTTGDSQFQDEITSWEEELWETWMRLALDETPMVQLVQDITRWMGNVSRRGAAELRGGPQVVPSNLHQEQERTQDVHPQPESILVLQEVMEKLRRVNQSLELMLTALEDAQSQLEKHLEHLKAVPDLDGQSRSAISSCIPHSSYFLLLLLPLVPASLRAILLLLFLASSALGIPATSTLLVLAVAGHWLVAPLCRGRIQTVVPREEPRYRLTSTPKRECNMELLQEELDRMDVSGLQGVLSQSVPKLCQGVCYHPRVSPPSTWGQEHCEGVSTPAMFLQSPGAAPRGGRGHSWIFRVTLELVVDAGKLWEPKPCSLRAKMCLCHILTTSSSLAMDSSPQF